MEAGEKNGVRHDVAAASAERLERSAAQGHADETWLPRTSPVS
ncbi:hypothetical protein ACIHCQ_36520 [Streptomyces sp. NPDC052236]